MVGLFFNDYCYIIFLKILINIIRGANPKIYTVAIPNPFQF